MLPEIFTNNTIKQIIRRYNFAANKSLGQNFLVNHSLTRKIIALSGDLTNKTILEVGPGPGCLTKAILEEKIKKLILIEKDPSFFAFLKILEEQSVEKVRAICADFLKIDLQNFFACDSGVIISNLPYNISSEFLLKSCQNADLINKMVIMFQKEVAERIVAQPGTKKYGRISILTQSFFKVKKIINISPNAFDPQPKVYSAVVLFEKDKKLPIDIKLKNLEQVTHLLFSKRRKKVSSILKNYSNLGQLEFDLNLRPENLKLSNIYDLTRFIYSNYKNK
jgi:16S rRNA (adenine1518-N6/adenine1519-N6)-dimethyltransferase